jgi:hypothetical protein
MCAWRWTCTVVCPQMQCRQKGICAVCQPSALAHERHQHLGIRQSIHMQGWLVLEATWSERLHSFAIVDSQDMTRYMYIPTYIHTQYTHMHTHTHTNMYTYTRLLRSCEHGATHTHTHTHAQAQAPVHRERERERVSKERAGALTRPSNRPVRLTAVSWLLKEENWKV